MSGNFPFPPPYGHGGGQNRFGQMPPDGGSQSSGSVEGSQSYGYSNYPSYTAPYPYISYPMPSTFSGTTYPYNDAYSCPGSTDYYGNATKQFSQSGPGFNPSTSGTNFAPSEGRKQSLEPSFSSEEKTRHRSRGSVKRRYSEERENPKEYDSRKRRRSSRRSKFPAGTQR